jgi:hypothetical protein
MRKLLSRWKLILALVLTVLVIYLLLAEQSARLTEARANRITAGMSRDQVESVLGPPNDLPGQAKQSFWDTYTFLGCRYIGFTVYYDDHQIVKETKISTFWRAPWQAFMETLRVR